MTCHPPRTIVISRPYLLLLLCLLLSPALYSQSSPVPSEPGAPGSDALPFLTDLFSRYEHATTYRFEYSQERQFTGEFMSSWTQTFVISNVGPANQYRFERRGNLGAAVQVSDGKTEWIYSPRLNQYMQQPTPSAGPTQIHTQASMGLQFLRDGQYSLKSIARFRDLIRTAKFAPDQDLQMNGKTIPCTIITAQGVPPDSHDRITTSFTFWVDKQSRLIRKYTSRDDGELVPTDPGALYFSETERLYSIAELNPSSFPDGTFAFTPPATAFLVKQFEDKQTLYRSEFVGKSLPSVTLKAPDGREISLQSFLGKPLLLDFWATWCGPCRESLPNLEKLYQETKEKGLVFLSLDEDEQPQKATDFWTQHKEPWHNYHIDRQNAGKFPSHGIPYFVLVDSSGNVSFSRDGMDENDLHAALASLTSSTIHAPSSTP